MALGFRGSGVRVYGLGVQEPAFVALGFGGLGFGVYGLGVQEPGWHQLCERTCASRPHVASHESSEAQVL